MKGITEYEKLVGTTIGCRKILRVIKDDSSSKTRYRLFCECVHCGKQQIKHKSEIVKYQCKCLRVGLTQNKHAAWKGVGDISGKLWCEIKAQAKYRRKELNITLEYIWNLYLQQNKKCAYSGIELLLPKSDKEHQLGTASLDRIDSSKGYIVDNVQWVHKKVNNMKGTLSHKEFVDFCNLISKNLE